MLAFSTSRKGLRGIICSSKGVQTAPAKLAALQARVHAKWREEQGQRAEKAVGQFCNKFLRIEEVEKVDFAAGKVQDYLSFVASCQRACAMR